MKKYLFVSVWLIFFVGFSFQNSQAQKFIHPGIDQTPADMEYMKKQVLAGEQP